METFSQCFRGGGALTGPGPPSLTCWHQRWNKELSFPRDSAPSPASPLCWSLGSKAQGTHLPRHYRPLLRLRLPISEGTEGPGLGWLHSKRANVTAFGKSARSAEAAQLEF